MNLFFSWAEGVVRDFNIWDIAIFKTYHGVVGIIVGAYISDFVKKRIWLFAVIAVLTGTWLVYRMFS